MVQIKQMTFSKISLYLIRLVNSNRRLFYVVYITGFLDSISFEDNRKTMDPFICYFETIPIVFNIHLYMHYNKATLNYKTTPTQKKNIFGMCNTTMKLTWYLMEW